MKIGIEAPSEMTIILARMIRQKTKANYKLKYNVSVLRYRTEISVPWTIWFVSEQNKMPWIVKSCHIHTTDCYFKGEIFTLSWQYSKVNRSARCEENGLAMLIKDIWLLCYMRRYTSSCWIITTSLHLQKVFIVDPIVWKSE